MVICMRTRVGDHVELGSSRSSGRLLVDFRNTSSRAARWSRGRSVVTRQALVQSNRGGASEGAQGPEPTSGFDRSGVAGAHQDNRPPVQFLWDDRERRRGARLVGAAHEVAVEAEDLVSVACVPEDGAGQNAGSDGVELELERGDHREVAAPSAQRPEEIGVLVGAGRQQLTVGGDDIGASRLSTARPCLRMSQPMPPPRVRPATPVEGLMPPVVASPWAWVCWSTSPQRTALHLGRPRCRVDPDGPHRSTGR